MKQKINLSIITFFLTGFILANTEEFSKPYIVISLGNCCKTAYFIRKHKLNTFAYPLDWVMTPFDSIYKVIKNDFQDYFAFQNLLDLNLLDRKTNTIYWWYHHRHVLDKLYNIESRHDFTLDVNIFNLNQYKEIKEKYERRIARFYRAINSGKPIYFVRREITKSQAELLSQLVSDKFPALNYVIVALDNTEEIKVNWKIKNVKNFYLDDPSYRYDPIKQRYYYSWRNNVKEWVKIFSKLGITVDTSTLATVSMEANE